LRDNQFRFLRRTLTVSRVGLTSAVVDACGGVPHRTFMKVQ
jgi:hypothetical protein